MGNDEDYEQGVRDGQRGGFLDDLARSFHIGSGSYEKGYDYGVDHRRDSSGERYHTWDGKGTNDPKPDSGSSSSSWSWFGFGSDSSKSSDESESSESESNTSSNGSYSGGCGWSEGGGGRASSTRTGIGGLVRVLGGVVIIGSVICLGISGKSSSKPNLHQQTKVATKIADRYNGKSLEENLELLLADLRRSNWASRGNIDDYKIIPPRKVRRLENSGSDSEYEMALIGHHYPLCILYTSDNGKNWTANHSPNDPFFKKLCFDEAFQTGVKHDKWAENVVRDLERYASRVDRQTKAMEENRILLKNTTISAGENVKRLYRYVQANYQLGDLHKYGVHLSEKMIIKEHREIALFNDHAFYVFHSSDNGMTWIPLPPTDQGFIRLKKDFERKISKKSNNY